MQLESKSRSDWHKDIRTKLAGSIAGVAVSIGGIFILPHILLERQSQKPENIVDVIFNAATQGPVIFMNLAVIGAFIFCFITCGSLLLITIVRYIKGPGITAEQEREFFAESVSRFDQYKY